MYEFASSTGECLKILRGHTTGIWSVAFSGEGRRLASGGDDQVVMLWDVETGACLNTLYGHTHRIWVVKFCPVAPDAATLTAPLLISGGKDEV
ncbi:MAG TPA: hypothetical protein V6C57_21850 [Coleofasciculaceae cyanobacterium]